MAKAEALSPPAVTVDGPVDRHDAGELQERPQRRDPEEGRLPEKAGEATQGRHEEEPVDEAVGVIGHQDDRTLVRKVLTVHDLHGAEEDAHQEPGQQGH